MRAGLIDFGPNNPARRKKKNRLRGRSFKLKRLLITTQRQNKQRKPRLSHLLSLLATLPRRNISECKSCQIHSPIPRSSPFGLCPSTITWRRQSLTPISVIVASTVRIQPYVLFHFPRKIELCPRTNGNSLGFISRFKVLVFISLSTSLRFIVLYFLLRWRGERGACDKSVWFYSCWPENLLARASGKITREISLCCKPYSVQKLCITRYGSYLLPSFPR